MKLYLRDRNEPLIEAWRKWFEDEPGDISIECGNIFDQPADAIVSPANSFGWMNGGIDQAYTDRFGTKTQERLHSVLLRDHWGELPVGQAVIVETEDPEFPLLVSAPTMRIPETVQGTLNAYLAFRAAKLAVIQWNERNLSTQIRSILCPGLATATGRIPYDLVARQMLCAWRAPMWPGACEGDFATPWALGCFMKGEMSYQEACHYIRSKRQNPQP